MTTHRGEVDETDITLSVDETALANTINELQESQLTRVVD